MNTENISINKIEYIYVNTNDIIMYIERNFKKIKLKNVKSFIIDNQQHIIINFKLSNKNLKSKIIINDKISKKELYNIINEKILLSINNYIKYGDRDRECLDIG